MKNALLVLFLSCSLGLFGQQFDTLSIRAAIEQQITAYPESTLQDIYKNFYQDRFGPGHIISDTASARSYLMHELSEMGDTSTVYYDRQEAKAGLSACIYQRWPTATGCKIKQSLTQNEMKKENFQESL